MSRWERWTTQPKQGMSLSGFIAEQQSPAEMAQSMGLQSDGSGGYVDESGNVVARTVNNELVFYDPMGGAISAQSDGAALTQAQPSWRDPVTGEITVPPGQAESPEEIAAIPDIVPAQAPASYNAFMNKKKKEMYANQAPPEQEAVDDIQQEADPEMGMQPEMGQGMAMGMESKTFSDYMSEEPEQNNEPNNQPEQPQRLNLRDYRLARRPKGKGLAAQRKQSAYDQRFPERQPQSPQQNISESEQKAESARRSSFQHRIESTIPANDNTSQQESNSIAAIMHGLKNPVSSLDENEDLFQMTQANQPDLADPKKGKEWFDAYVQQARRVREILNMKDDDSDDDWMVERTQNRNRLNFVDSKDQHDLMQHIWDIMGDDVRKNRYGSQMDTFNPADMSLVRRSQYEQIRGAIDKIAKEFGGNSDILPEIINTYLHSQISQNNMLPISLKESDLARGVDVDYSPINLDDPPFNIDHDEDGNPRMFSSNFMEGGRPRTNLGIKENEKDGEGLGFDGHSFTMTPEFQMGDKKDNYKIEHKMSSLIGDAFEIREMVEGKPENVPWKQVKDVISNAAARGGSVPVQELVEMIQELTGEDINFRTGIKPQLKKNGTPGSKMEEDDFSDEDKEYWGDTLQSLMDEKDDDDNPFFDFGAGTNFNGEELDAKEHIGRLFDLANSKEGHNKKFQKGLRSKLRQLRIMKAMQASRKSGSNDFGKMMAKLKFMAAKKGFKGGREKGGYYKLQ